MSNIKAEIIPETPTIFRLKFDANLSYCPWSLWKWCRADDLVLLINETFHVSWTRKELLTRFALDPEKIEGSGFKKYNETKLLSVVMEGEDGPCTFVEYRDDLIPELVKDGTDFLVPAGWSKKLLDYMVNRGVFGYAVLQKGDKHGNTPTVFLLDKSGEPYRPAYA